MTHWVENTHKSLNKKIKSIRQSRFSKSNRLHLVSKEIIIEVKFSNKVKFEGQS